MLITYLTAYLVFLIIVALAVSFLVWRLRLSSGRLAVIVIMLIIASPIIFGYLYLTYSTSIPEIEVPYLIGVNSAEAISRLENLNLRVRFSGATNDPQYAAGLVISQQPEAGRRVKEGRLISFIVSSGRRKVIMPNLIGRTLAQAETTARAKGLAIGTIETEPVAGAPDLVLSQSPWPEEVVEQDTAIKLVISASGESGEDKGQERKKGGFWLW